MAPSRARSRNVLTVKGYRVLGQDYDIPLGASFAEAMPALGGRNVLAVVVAGGGPPKIGS